MNYLFVFLTIITSFSAIGQEKPKVYHSFDSEFFATLTVVPAEGIDTYYVNYNGFEHHYDGNTLLYKKFKNDLDEGYYLKLLGMPDINFKNEGYKTVRSGTLVSYSSVYLDNDTITKVIYSGTADIVKANNIKEQYQVRQLNVVSKVAAKKLVEKSVGSFSTTCETNVEIDIDWPQFEIKKRKTSPAKLSAYMKALENICTIDHDYLEVIQEIEKIRVIPSTQTDKHEAKILNKTLYIEIGDDVTNLPETSYKLIYDIL
ncbi:hypothetical protein [Pseudoalteromonas prydzensis]|uniref:hypothetical protein n=1 Tax=Pseudoalteromonas prydzensis TaxID=182141 RepID=UPI0024BCD3AD|nr:hypothetical protein [Pseudoalteromonas prydzensis]